MRAAKKQAMEDSVRTIPIVLMLIPRWGGAPSIAVVSESVMFSSLIMMNLESPRAYFPRNN